MTNLPPVDAGPVLVPPSEPADRPLAAPMTHRRVLALAVPIIGENLLQTAVGAVDTLMVARVGEVAVAGVGTAIEVIYILLAILSAVSVGATVLVSQAFGARDYKRTRHLARQTVVWAIALSIPVSLGGFFLAGSIVGIFGTAPDVASVATHYLQVTTLASAVLVLEYACGGIFRGIGDSRTPLFAALIANVVNVAVAYGLIFGHAGLPTLGAEGSAWGAVAGRSVGAGLLLLLLLRRRLPISIRGRDGWRPHLVLAEQLFRLGFPAALEQLLVEGGFTVLMAVVATLGTAALAAQQIAFTALSVAFLPGLAFETAATALVGQSIGAKRFDDARRAARMATLWATVWMGIGAVLYLLFPGPELRFFSDVPAVVDAGVDGLRAMALSLPMWAIWLVFGGALRGRGDTRTPLITSTLATWLAVGLAFVAVHWLSRGLGAVWLTFVVTAPVAALGNWLILRKRERAALTPHPLPPS